MRRRQLLVTAGSVAAVGLCGCTDTSQSSDGGTDDTDSGTDSNDADNGTDGSANSGDTTEESGGDTQPESVVKAYLAAKVSGDVETLKRVVHEDRQGAIDDSAPFGGITINSVSEVTAEELAAENENFSAEEVRAEAQSIVAELNAEGYAIVTYDIEVAGNSRTGREILITDGDRWQVIGEEPTSPQSPAVAAVEQFWMALADGDTNGMREVVHPTDHDMIPDGGSDLTVEEAAEISPANAIDITDSRDVSPEEVQEEAQKLADAVDADDYALVYSRVETPAGPLEQVYVVVQTDGDWLVRLEVIR